MCEANVYMVDKEGRTSLYLEAVDRLMPQGDKLILENIFGQKKIITARVKELLLADHKIILEKAEE